MTTMIPLHFPPPRKSKMKTTLVSPPKNKSTNNPKIQPPLPPHRPNNNNQSNHPPHLPHSPHPYPSPPAQASTSALLPVKFPPPLSPTEVDGRFQWSPPKLPARWRTRIIRFGICTLRVHRR